jgi:hypothetical protein
MEHLGSLVDMCTDSKGFMTVKLYGIVPRIKTALLAWHCLVHFQTSEQLLHKIRIDVAPGPIYRAQVPGEQKVLICLIEMQF